MALTRFSVQAEQKNQKAITAMKPAEIELVRQGCQPAFGVPASSSGPLAATSTATAMQESPDGFDCVVDLACQCVTTCECGMAVSSIDKGLLKSAARKVNDVMKALPTVRSGTGAVIKGDLTL